VTWEFATAGRIVFGPGVHQRLPALAQAFGTRPLLVLGGHAAREEIVPRLNAAGRVMVRGEPTIETVRDGVRAFRRERCDLVIAIGGGSVMDTGKAIAALAPNSGEPLDYLEVIGRGRQLETAPAPCIAVPTTAGSGAEVTRNAVLGSPEHAVKASLRHVGMLPRIAVVDPELTLKLPTAITVTTGLDALTQLVEPYVSQRATPLTDVLCLAGIRRIARALPTAASDAGGSNLTARSDMAIASLFGGIALANAGLGVVHGCAAPLGAMFSAPHAAVCAALLPHGMAANLRALRERAPGHPAIDRYQHVAAAFTGNGAATPEDGAAAVGALCATLNVEGLAAFGVRASQLDDICQKAQQANSMKANPIALSEDELRALIAAAV
jgi:alcohol dehydrogenase class IV